MNTVEKFQFMISLFAMIATSGAAIAAKRSLVEQGLNSKRALTPLLVINNAEYSANFNSERRFSNLNWGDHNIIPVNNIDFSPQTLELINISKGTANNLIIEIELDYSELLFGELTKLNDENRIDVSIGSDPFDENNELLYFIEHMYVEKSNSLVPSSAGSYNLNRVPKQRFLFIGPEGDNKKIFIPKAFVAIYNLYFGSYKPIDVSLLPSLKIKLTYDDIVNTTYTSKYILQLKAICRSIRSDQVDNNIEFEVILEE